MIRQGVLLLLFFLVSFLYGTDTKHVLLLHSYHPGFEWVKGITSAVEETFDQSDIPLHLHIEYLDTKRIPFTPEYRKRTFEYLQYKYSDITPDLILVSDDNALSFVQESGDALFGDIPLVFCGINEYSSKITRTGTAPVTGVAEPIFAGSVFSLMTSLLDTVDTVFVVNDHLPSGKKIGREIEQQFEPYGDSLVLRHLPVLPMVELEERLSSISPSNAVLLGIYFRDAENRFFTSREVARRLSSAARVPVFTLFDFYISHGVLGGVAASSRKQGAFAARRAVRILQGGTTSVAVEEDSISETIVNYPVLKKESHSASRLPEDVRILNRPYSFYERYFLQIVFVSVIFVGLIFLIILMMIERRRRLASERKLHRVNADLAEKVKDLEQSRTFSVQAVNHSRELFGWLTPEGHVRFCNETALQMAGISLKDIQGIFFWETPWFKDDGEKQVRLKKAIAEAAAGTPVQYETWHIDFRGERHEISFYLQPVTDGEGEVFTLVAEGVDITDIRRAAQKEKELTEQLYQSQKMDALGQLAGGVAHDFNNMLSGIIGAAEVLQEECSPGERQEFLETIITAGERAAYLTRQLLSFSRKGSHEKKRVRLAPLLKETVTLLRRTVDKSVEIHVAHDDRSFAVIGDDALIQNALVNLGVNAVHAMPRGGLLEYRLAVTELEEEFCKYVSFDIDPGRYVQISVRDTGKGIPYDIQERIFEPFFTTKARGKGTGLGLSAVYGMVQKHRGAVKVYSEMGRGTEFHIYLPAADVDSREESPGQSAPVTGAERGTVLVVDDEAVIRSVARAMLSSFGYSVITAENGREGVDLFQEKHEDIDMVILDMIMPVMGGRDAFTRIQEIDSTVPVLIVSGFAENSDVDELVRRGAAGVMRKPFRKNKLAEIVRKTIRFSEE
ncbi:MAG: hybrid sensor histidine kinase/response regulator [Fibrobacterota bacterium]